MKSKLLALMAVCILALTACGDDSSGGDLPPSTETSTSTSTSVPSSPATTTLTSPTTPVSGGADAAPGAGYSGLYNASQEAANLFRDWYAYEKYQIDLPGQVVGLEVAYTNGVAIVCTQRARGTTPSTLVGYLAQNKGYNKTDAAAVVAAAFRALCPRDETNSTQQSLAGYQTDFDANVASAYRMLTQSGRFTFYKKQPSLYDVGWFTKHVCSHLQVSQNSGDLLSYLVSHGNDPINGSSFLSGADQQVVGKMAVDVVTSACPGYISKLPPAWFI